jgi:hypothetical protein
MYIQADEGIILELILTRGITNMGLFCILPSSLSQVLTFLELKNFQEFFYFLRIMKTSFCFYLVKMRLLLFGKGPCIPFANS